MDIDVHEAKKWKTNIHKLYYKLQSVRAITGRKVVGREEWEAFIWLMFWYCVKNVHVMLLKTCTWSASSLNQTSSEGHEILVKKNLVYLWNKCYMAEEK